MDYKIRTILEGEDSLLTDFLYEAIFVPEGVPAPPKSIINQPELQVYIADFGKKKDDIGLAAEVDKNVAALFQFMTGNAANAKKRWTIKSQFVGD